MKRVNGLWIAAGCIGFITTASLVASEWQQSSNAESRRSPVLMLAKLASTQKVVAGLVSKNFSEIKKGAEEMVQICDASQWQSNPDPVYGHHRTELRRQASRLVKTAEDQNLDGCAFNYVQTISTCISCHEHCRDVLRLAEIPRQDNMVIPIPTSEQELDWRRAPSLRR